MIKLNYAKSSNPTDAFAKVKEAITPELIKKYGVSADFDYNEADGKIVASGKGFEFFMNFLDKEVEADLKLSMLLKPFKKKIIESLEKQLKRVV